LPAARSSITTWLWSVARLIPRRTSVRAATRGCRTPWIGSWLREIVPWLTRGLLVGRLIVPDLRWVWAFVGIGLLVGLLMNHIFNRQVSASAAALSQRPITAFFMGLLVLLLAGPILALVAASVIGLAIVPFAIAAMFVATLIGKIGVARVLGRGIIAETEPDNRVQSLRSYLLAPSSSRSPT
jgi:hypothetical protein